MLTGRIRFVVFCTYKLELTLSNLEALDLHMNLRIVLSEVSFFLFFCEVKLSLPVAVPTFFAHPHISYVFSSFFCGVL